MDEKTLKAFRAGFQGEVVLPGDAAYETARRVWNGMIDRRPAVIARCRSTADVGRAIAFGREGSLPIAVRGGAHNVAGNATVDDGIVVDLSPMKGIEVDAGARRAFAQPGMTWADFDQATAKHGLATTGGLVSSTGIAGFTLGGGIGGLMRAPGLACDNLVGAAVVTADGRTLHASAAENPDLYWALRGGGGNFGVVTRFDFRLHPAATVVGGMTLYPATRAAAVLRYFREFTASAPDELTALFGFLTAPPAPFLPAPMQGMPAVAIVLCCSGDLAEAEQTVRGIKRWGPPAVDLIGPMPYLALQSMLDAGAPSGAHNYWKAGYLDRLDDAAIDTIVEHAARMGPGLSQVHLHQMGGAVARVPGEATAFTNRQAAFAVNVIGMWTDPAETARHVAWARGFSEALQPHTNGGVYVNFLGDEGEDRVRAAYGPETYARLAKVKAAYDPDNVFKLNQNIRPAGTPARRQ